VRRTAPWWLGWLLAGSLFALFLGERVLAGAGVWRLVLSGLGALGLVAAAAWRVAAWRAADGESRRVEGVLALAYAGCVLALVVYFVSSDVGARALGLELELASGDGARTRTLLQVVWSLLLGLSLLPALAAQLSAGRPRRLEGSDGMEGVEVVRVLEATGSGLVVALAGASLLLLGYVASTRDKTVDLSYFKTATPGSATEAMVASAEDRSASSCSSPRSTR
jgi:hypothetical protein